MHKKGFVDVIYKEHFWSLDETEERIEPRFSVQVWDNELISADDFLG